MQKIKNSPPNFFVFKMFLRSRYLLIMGFVFSTALINFNYLDVFFDFTVFKILTLNFFFFSLFFFLFSFFIFFFLVQKKKIINVTRNLFKIIFIAIILTVLINIVFFLKMYNVIELENIYLVLIFFPIQIMMFFTGTLSSTKILYIWQKTFLKTFVKKEINKANS